MARTKRSRRSYGAGEWGRNRVRVFPESKTGLFQVEWREDGRRLSRSLKHRDWRRAKRQADEFGAGFAGPELNGKAESEPLTLGRLFDIYREEVTPSKAKTSQRSDRAAMRMFLKFFGGAYSDEVVHPFRAKRSACSGPSRPPVPSQAVRVEAGILKGCWTRMGQVWS